MGIQEKMMKNRWRHVWRQGAAILKKEFTRHSEWQHKFQASKRQGVLRLKLNKHFWTTKWIIMLLKIASLIWMTSPDDVIFLKFSEIHGQYFPLSNFKKKDTLVFSSLSSIRLGLSPKGLVKRKRPTAVSQKRIRVKSSTLHCHTC